MRNDKNYTLMIKYTKLDKKNYKNKLESKTQVDKLEGKAGF